MIGLTSAQFCQGMLDRLVDVPALFFTEYEPAPVVSDASTVVTLDRRLRHATGIVRRYEVKRQDVPSHFHLVETSLLAPNVSVSLCSTITPMGARMHIPMMDFVTDAALEDVVEGMGRIQGDGVIVQSTRSYHFLGSLPLSHEAWRQFLGRALLLDHIVDSRYVGHCLIEGECSLRISKGTAAEPPIVVSTIP